MQYQVHGPTNGQNCAKMQTLAISAPFLPFLDPCRHSRAVIKYSGRAPPKL